MINNKLLVPVVAVLVAGGSYLGLTSLSYATDSNAPFSDLAKTIATKFNLNQTEVQSTIDTYHKTHFANREKDMLARQQEHLDQLVKDGKITAAQKQAIITKRQELRSKYPMDPKQTPEQRRTSMQQMRDEWNTWVKSQSLDPTIVGMGLGKGRGHHDGGGFGRNGMATTPYQTQ